MTNIEPYICNFAGTDYTVYPHKARMVKVDSYGMRPITVGGHVVGYFMKDDAGSYNGYDSNRQPLYILTDKLRDCAELVAMRDEARDAYRRAAREGVFGVEALFEEQLRMDQVIANLDETTELIHIEVPEVDRDALDYVQTTQAGRGSRHAETRLAYVEGHFLGTLVREPSESHETPVWAAHTPAGRRTQGMDYCEAKQVLLDAHRAAQALDRSVCQEESSVTWPVGGRCGATLAEDGSCPAARAHRVVVRRRDRNDALKEAARQLNKALVEQSQLHHRENDLVADMIESMLASVDMMREHLKATGD